MPFKAAQLLLTALPWGAGAVKIVGTAGLLGFCFLATEAVLAGVVGESSVMVGGCFLPICAVCWAATGLDALTTSAKASLDRLLLLPAFAS